MLRNAEEWRFGLAISVFLFSFIIFSFLDALMNNPTIAEGAAHTFSLVAHACPLVHVQQCQGGFETALEQLLEVGCGR